MNLSDSSTWPCKKCNTKFFTVHNFTHINHGLNTTVPRQLNSSPTEIVKWGASSRWSPALYFLIRNSDQMTIVKTHPALYSSQFLDTYNGIFLCKVPILNWLYYFVSHVGRSACTPAEIKRDLNDQNLFPFAWSFMVFDFFLPERLSILWRFLIPFIFSVFKIFI